jgi:hypothetical protein
MRYGFHNVFSFFFFVLCFFFFLNVILWYLVHLELGLVITLVNFIKVSHDIKKKKVSILNWFSIWQNQIQFPWLNIIKIIRIKIGTETRLQPLFSSSFFYCSWGMFLGFFSSQSFFFIFNSYFLRILYFFFPKLYFIHLLLQLERWERKKSSYNKGGEKKLSIGYVLATKKVVIDVNEFHFMREISMMCFLPLILLEKVDLAFSWQF